MPNRSHILGEVHTDAIRFWFNGLAASAGRNAAGNGVSRGQRGLVNLAPGIGPEDQSIRPK